MKIRFVNVYMIGEGGQWVLVDAGLKGFAGKIVKVAKKLFGVSRHSLKRRIRSLQRLLILVHKRFYYPVI